MQIPGAADCDFQTLFTNICPARGGLSWGEGQLTAREKASYPQGIFGCVKTSPAATHCFLKARELLLNALILSGLTLCTEWTRGELKATRWFSGSRRSRLQQGT